MRAVPRIPTRRSLAIKALEYVFTACERSWWAVAVVYAVVAAAVIAINWGQL